MKNVDRKAKYDKENMLMQDIIPECPKCGNKGFVGKEAIITTREVIVDKTYGVPCIIVGCSKCGAAIGVLPFANHS